MVNQILAIKALSSKVLVVATKGSIDDWSAYIDAVEGQNHLREADEVATSGTKISQELAEFLFPELAKMYNWRR